MHLIRNRRSTRAFVVALAAGVLAAVPVKLLAQDTASTVPNTHTVKKGDTLWDLAAKYLSDAFRWPEIYRLNTDVVQDPHWIYPGEILKLPGYIGTELPAGGIAIPNANPTQAPPTPAQLDTVKRNPTTSETTTLFGRRGGAAAPLPVASAPTPVAAPTPADTTLKSAIVAPSVRYGDFLQAPWIERRGGPVVWGRIIGSAELPGIDPARQRSRFQMNDRVLIAPPTGSVAPKGDLYLTYHYGPLLEEAGQVIIPTGVIEVLRPPLNGDAAIAQVVRM